MADIEKKWYVLRAITGKENKVKEYIELEMKAQHYEKYVSQIFIPTRKKEIISGTKSGTKRTIKDVSIIPGYVLVEAALVGEVAHMLRQTPNVLGFLGGMDNPTPLRPSEINRMLGVDVEEQGNQMETEIEMNYMEGESVKVVDGPFGGFVGTIEEVNNDKQKLKVSVKIFGRATSLEMSFRQVTRE